MKENVISCYNYINEDGRLSYNNVRKVEYITNKKYILKHVHHGMKVLDCACGTGAYVFDLFEAGAEVTAGDLTQKHIDILSEKLKEKSITQIRVSVLDATNLSCFLDATFDMVLCMGPLYHLLEVEEQYQCIRECMRITRKGGILVFAYLNKYAILPYMMKKKPEYIRKDIVEKFLKEGKTRWGVDDFCFFTDSYYHTPEEIEAIMNLVGIKKLEHIASDGVSHDYAEMVNSMGEEEFKVWLIYHLHICEQRSMLGISQHGLFIGQK